MRMPEYPHVANPRPTNNQPNSNSNRSHQLADDWRRGLYKRNLCDKTIAHFKIEPTVHVFRRSDGQTVEVLEWAYPLSPDSPPTRRKKAYKDDPGPKYRWAGAKPADYLLYDVDGKLQEHVAANGGVLYLAAGEPDVWALYEAGIFHATCSVRGEASPLSNKEVRQLAAWGVREIRIAPDRDPAGMTFAQNTSRVGQANGMQVRGFELPYPAESGADIGTLLQNVGAAGLKDALASLPEMDLGALCSDQPHAELASRSSSSLLSPPASELYEQWCLEVEAAAVRVWDIPERNGTDFSRKNFQCPFHDDMEPSASWNYRTHQVHCFACGHHTTHEAAAELSFTPYQEWKAQTGYSNRSSCKKKRSRKGAKGDELTQRRNAGGAASGGNPPRSTENDNHDDEQPDKPYVPTHDEIGDSLIAKYDGNVRYFYGYFHRYREGVWQRDEAKEFRAEIWEEMKAHKCLGIRPSKNLKSSIEDYLISALGVRPTELADGGRRYINVRNGLLNLETLQLEPHNRELFILSQLPFDYDPNADCPVWKRCLSVWLRTSKDQTDQTLIQLLQEAFGYSLTADTHRQTGFWLYGRPASGKSTVLKVLAALGGDSHLTLNLGVLAKEQHQLIRIPGKRIITCSEASAGTYLNDGLLKQLISREEIMVRPLYRDPYSVIPNAKVWWAMNERPKNQDTSGAVERRLEIFSFNNAIPPEAQDQRLMDKLLAELPGILNWSLEGLERLNRNDRFTVAEQAQSAREEYRLENDPVHQFIHNEAFCVLGEEHKTQASDLGDAYRVWARAYGQPTYTDTALSKRWKELGFEKHTSGVTFYHGIGLTNAARALPPA